MKEEEFEKINPQEIAVNVYYYIDEELNVVLDDKEMIREFQQKIKKLNEDLNSDELQRVVKNKMEKIKGED